MKIVGTYKYPVPCGYGYREVERKVGECDVCGKKVELAAFTNTCVCGADYNMSGCRLASRSQWGEETGETATEILQSTPHHQM